MKNPGMAPQPGLMPGSAPRAGVGILLLEGTKAEALGGNAMVKFFLRLTKQHFLKKLPNSPFELCALLTKQN
jgi:hypothetical protein